jgi:hypothetical protein
MKAILDDQWPCNDVRGAFPAASALSIFFLEKGEKARFWMKSKIVTTSHTDHRVPGIPYNRRASPVRIDRYARH